MSELGDRIAALTPEERIRLEERLRRPRTGAGGVTPRPAGAEPRLSFGQERLWHLSRRMDGSAAHHMHTSYRIRGPLDVAMLESALADVVRLNGALRTKFVGNEGHPIAAEPSAFDLAVTDLTTSSDLDEAVSRVSAWAEQPMDLTTGPLFAAHLWRRGSDDHILSIRAHHIVCDGWSLSLIEGQIVAGYAGREIEGAPLEYADFVAWERSRESLLRQRLEAWTSVVEDASPLRLPGDRVGSGGELRFQLSPEVSAAINASASALRATPFTVLMAAFVISPNRHTGQEDMMICSPVAGRPDPALERIVGYFNDIVPIRTAVEDDLSAADVIESLGVRVLASVDAAVPFQWIAAAARETALTRGLFALNDVPHAGLALGDLTVEPLAVAAASSDFGLGWFMRFSDDCYRGTVRHKSANDAPIVSLIDDFRHIASAISARPDTKVSEFADRSEEWSHPPDSSPTSVQPASLVEARLQRLWEQVFGRRLAVDDDFFDLGGHSLLAAELIADIEREFGLEPMPLSTLFEAPTVARFARLLEGDTPDEWKSLVPIKTTGDRPPLFFVHAHGGNVIGYSDLARNLSPRQPLYGLQSPRGGLGVRRIEEMAKSYLDEIRTVQPEGPYFVGGWCLGGDVAFEMAQQLRQSGAEVALVLMVDNPRAEHIATAPSSPLRRRIDRMVTRLEMELSNLIEVPAAQRGHFVMERTGRLGRRLLAAVERLFSGKGRRLPFGLEHSQTFRQSQVAALHEKAYEAYAPEPYEGSVAIFRAERQPRGRKLDPSLGWSPYIHGTLIDHQLPGHRIGLLSEPRIKRGARIIEEAIAQALGEVGEGAPT